MYFFKLFLILTIVLLSNLNAQSFSDPWPKGNIKSVKLSIFENHFELNKQPIVTSKAKFDINRKITELIDESQDGYYKKQDWIRNNSDSTITSNNYQDRSEKIHHKSIYYVDGKGHYKYEISYNLEEMTEAKNYYTYNEFGKQTKVLFYNKRGDLYGERIFEYDESQNRIKFKHTNFYSSIDNYENQYKFDKNNNLIELKKYGPLETLVRKETFLYDGNNLLIEKIIELREREFLEYQYFEYLNFDDNGNYTKRLIFDNKERNGTPKRTEIREILYY